MSNWAHGCCVLSGGWKTIICYAHTETHAQLQKHSHICAQCSSTHTNNVKYGNTQGHTIKTRVCTQTHTYHCGIKIWIKSNKTCAHTFVEQVQRTAGQCIHPHTEKHINTGSKHTKVKTHSENRAPPTYKFTHKHRYIDTQFTYTLNTPTHEGVVLWGVLPVCCSPTEQINDQLQCLSSA